MRLTYSPDGVDPMHWDFTTGDLYEHEAEAMERQTGQTIAELGQALVKGSTTAVHAFLWVLMRRQEGRRGLKYDQVSFRLREVTIDLDPDEKHRVLEALDAKTARGEVLGEQEQAAYDALQAEFADLPDPKDPAS